MVAVADLDNFFEVLALHYLTSWVTWVNYNNASRYKAVFFRLDNLFFETFRVQTPSLFLLEIVRNQFRVVQSKQGRVQGVLWNWHKDTIMGVSDQSSKASSNTFGCAVSQIDFVGICLHSIAIGYELCDLVTHVGPALRINRVGT